MPSTDSAYGGYQAADSAEAGTVCFVPIVLRIRYSIPGTDIGYRDTHSLCDVGAGMAALALHFHTQCLELKQAMPLPGLSLCRPCPSGKSSYAMPLMCHVRN